MNYLSSTKQFILTSSNFAILALCAADVAHSWNQSVFELFLRNRLPQLWPCLLIYPALLLIKPLLPRPKPVVAKIAAAPSIVEARAMAVATALMDYSTVGGLFLFWDKVCRLMALSAPSLLLELFWLALLQCLSKMTSNAVSCGKSSLAHVNSTNLWPYS